jgi:branched-chain amino acid transport system substrate-binding protein
MCKYWEFRAALHNSGQKNANALEGPMEKSFRRATILAATGAILLTSSPAPAQKQYDTGATDTEIKVGQTMPFSGPASTYALIGRVMSGYFTMVNEVQGGINGRRVNLISYDDAFSPPKTVEQTRKLVESDEVLAVTASLGSPTKYLNAKKVPQILAMAGAAKLDDPANLPWTTTFYSSANVETQIYAEYILRERPQGKIAVLYQNDDFGKNYLTGLKAALGDKASMIIREESYNLTDPTIDSQVIALKASGADVLLIAAGPKFAAQVVRKNHELGWRPMQIIVTASSQIQTVLRPAGIEASKGLVTSQWIKEVGDPTWDDDPAMLAFKAFMAKWVSGAQPEDGSAAYAYSTAQMLHEILRRCGDDLRRENLIKQATNIKDFQLPLFVPGVTVNVSPTSRIGWRKARLVRFDGAKWTSFGDIVTIPESATRG